MKILLCFASEFFLQQGCSSNHLNCSPSAFIPLEYLNWEMINITEEELGMRCE